MKNTVKFFSKFLSVSAILLSYFITAVSAVSAQGFDYSYDFDLNNPLGAGVVTAAGYTIFVIICSCCIPLIVLAVIGFIIYKDAKKNEVNNPMLWAIICAITGIIGLLIYLLSVRPDAIKAKEDRQKNTSAVVNSSTTESSQ